MNVDIACAVIYSCISVCSKWQSAYNNNVQLLKKHIAICMIIQFIQYPPETHVQNCLQFLMGESFTQTWLLFPVLVPDMCVMKDIVCMGMESTTVLKKECGVETPAMYPHVKVCLFLLCNYKVCDYFTGSGVSWGLLNCYHIVSSLYFNAMVTYTVSLKACKSLTSIPHGHVAYQTIDTPTVLPGDVALYSCDAPYSLLGSEYRICLRNGSWSDSEPLCVGRWWFAYIVTLFFPFQI